MVLSGGQLIELPTGDSVPLLGMPLYVQSAAPVVVGNYAWFQTNYLVAGGLTLWVEDGT